MPHIIVEYTDNIKRNAKIPGLLKKLNSVLVSKPDVFPVGGIRSRAVELHDYVVADGQEDDAFVHITLKIGGGRTEEQKNETLDELFEVAKTHFQPLFEKRYFALSLEWSEFKNKTYKHNNIHSRYK